MHKFLLSFMVIVLLSGCASFVKGRTQNISIDTQQIKDARCSVYNDKGRWEVKKTPTVIAVSDSSRELEVSCIKSGYKTNKKKVASSTRGWLFGNVLFGPLFPIGMGIDMINGSAFEYPDNISVPMEAHPVVEQPKKAEPEVVKPSVPAKEEQKPQ